MEDERYLEAKKKVQNLKDFYTHLLVYILVNTGLIIINLLTFKGHLWFFYPLLGWGIGLVSHAFSVFGQNKMLGKDWEERKIAKYMSEDDKY